MQKSYLYLALLLFFNLNWISAQECYLSLEEILVETSKRDFAVSALYELVEDKYSNNEVQEVTIEGSISDPDFSFAIISMLPALRHKDINEWKLNLKYYKTNKRGFEEVLITEVISHLYPNMYLEYLILRAKEEFHDEWQKAVKRLGMDETLISLCIAKNEYLERTKERFTSTVLFDTYRIMVNNVDVVLIKEFYGNLEDYRIRVKCSSYFRCVSDAEWKTVNSLLNGSALGSPSIAKKYSPLYHTDRNKMYFDFLYCVGMEQASSFSQEIISANFIKQFVIESKVTYCLKAEFSAELPLNVNMDCCKTNPDFMFNKMYSPAIICNTNEAIEWGKIKK